MFSKHLDFVFLGSNNDHQFNSNKADVTSISSSPDGCSIREHGVIYMNDLQETRKNSEDLIKTNKPW